MSHELFSVSLIFSSWRRDKSSWIDLLKGGHLLEFQFTEITLRVIRLQNAIALFCVLVDHISEGVTPNKAVSGWVLRGVLHRTDRQSKIEEQKSAKEGQDQNIWPRDTWSSHLGQVVRTEEYILASLSLELCLFSTFENVSVLIYFDSNPSIK